MATKALITHAELLKALDYDPATGVFRWKWRDDVPKQVNTRLAGKIAGYINPDGYLIICINEKLYMAHRLAWFYMTGKWPKDEIDHEKGNRLDNSFEKLREATHGQNQRNRVKHYTNTSGIKGVSWHKSSKKWRATIRKDNRIFHLGTFDSIEDSSRSYREAADRLHGEFANHG